MLEVRRTFYIAVLLISSLVDLLRNLKLGPISASGVLTILYGIIVALLLVTESRSRRTTAKLIGPLALLFGWILLSWLWHWPSVEGFQETLSLEIFLGLIVLLAASEERSIRHLDVGKFLGWATALSAGLYAISLVLQGPGAYLILGSRTFALFALLGVSWCLAGWAYGSWKSLIYALALLLLVGFSLSRAAFVIGILLLPLSKLGGNRRRGIAQAGLATIVAGLFLFLAVSNIPALAHRLLGDNSVGELAAGDVTLNTSGRTELWPTVFDNFMKSPWIGRGTGSADDLVDSTFSSDIGHPHNDYLRFLHDYGVIGLGLFLIGIGGLLRKCWVARHKRKSGRTHSGRLSLAAFLALVATLLSMITDNTGSYVFVLGPLGIMIGTALRPLTGWSTGRTRVRLSVPRNLSGGGSIAGSWSR